MLTSDSKIPRFLSNDKIAYGDLIFDFKDERDRSYGEYFIHRLTISTYIKQFDDFFSIRFYHIPCKGFYFCFRDLRQLDCFLSRYKLNRHSPAYLDKLNKKFHINSYSTLLRLSCEELESYSKFYAMLAV